MVKRKLSQADAGSASDTLSFTVSLMCDRPFEKDLTYFHFVHMRVLLAYMHRAKCISGSYGGKKNVSRVLELKLLMVVRCCASAGSQPRGLWKSSH